LRATQFPDSCHGLPQYAGCLLMETIASLREQSAVQSGLVELQHVVMDGASTDNTRNVVAKF